MNRAQSGATTFETAFGFAAIAWEGHAIMCTSLPSPTEAAAARYIASKRGAHPFPSPAPSSVPLWVQAIVANIQKHFRGDLQHFDDVPIHLASAPPFHQKVYEVTRAIPLGETATYGEIARRAGSPHAARAIGQAMAKNPIPLIIPCHRVMGASNKLTGFTAPGGIATKERMLQLERKQQGLFHGAG